MKGERPKTSHLNVLYMTYREKHPLVSKVCAGCDNVFSQNRTDQKYCSKQCKHRTRSKENYKANPSKKKTVKYGNHIKVKDKCALCGFIPINKCQMDIDHIDGNHKNNSKSNLQILCANCHRLKTFLNKEGIHRT